MQSFDVWVRGVRAALLAVCLAGCVDDDPDTPPAPDGAAPDGASCLAADERCDGEDDDCDGMIDEGFAGLGEACERGVGPCAVGGTMVCAADGMGLTCSASPPPGEDEVCDGADNDCDGAIDEGVPDGPACETGGSGPCAAGVQRCVAGQVVCAPESPATDEVCDGLDNDCDGTSDEGEGGAPLEEPCYAGLDGTEGVGACRAGSRACMAGAFGACRGQVTPIDEICDGVDSDCDGQVDEGMGLGDACTVGVGACTADGIQVCDMGSGRVMCGVAPGEGSDEVCNAIDDDCDGAVDEVDGVGDACESGQGACAVAGVLACGEGEALVCDATPAPAGEEICNGIDDDCDGAVDDVDGAGEACRAGVGACAVDGALVCDAAAGALACDAVPGAPAPVEACGDGVDDDCDGRVDEAGCSVACVDDGGCPGSGCIDGWCGEPEVCDDGDDDDNDGLVDCFDPDCDAFAGCGPCGDRLLDPGEQCDDGNRAPGDGCSRDCAVEEGFSCGLPGLVNCEPGQPVEALTLDRYVGSDPVGGDGGEAFAERCLPGGVLIGFDVHIGDEWRFSNGNIHVQRLRAQCARVVLVDGAAVLTPAETLQPQAGVPDSGVPEGYTDALRCPPGEVVRGFTLYGADEYPQGIGISCGALGHADGVVLGDPVALPGVGPVDAVFGAADCPPGTVAAGNRGRAGHVLDQLALVCASPIAACGTPSVCEVDRACRFAFSGPDFDPVFEVGGDQPWFISPEGHATSGDVGDGQRSSLRMAVSMPEGGQVRFARRVGSEACCDGLTFLVDGELRGDWRGDVDWAEVGVGIDPGDHVLEWLYSKDDSLSERDDRAQIDDLAVTGAEGLCAAP